MNVGNRQYSLVCSFLLPFPFIISHRMEISAVLQRAFSHFLFRRKFRGKYCPCGIPISWSKIRKLRIHNIPCALHKTNNAPLILEYDSIHQIDDVDSFQYALQRKAEFYKAYTSSLYTIAIKKGEEFVKILFSTYFYRQQMKSVTCIFANDNLTVRYFMDCLQKGYKGAADILRRWPSVQASLQKGLPVYQMKYIGNPNPVLRDELRNPVFKSSFERYVAQHDCDKYSCCVWRSSTNSCPCKKLAGDFTGAVCRYNVVILRFWILVKSKLKAWKTAHGFAPAGLFISSTDSLAVLIRRNPYRVPSAAEEFGIAAQKEPITIENEYVHTHGWKTWLKWLGQNQKQTELQIALGIYLRSGAPTDTAIHLAKLFENPGQYCLPNSFLLGAAYFLKKYPADCDNSSDVFYTLLNCLHNDTGVHSGVICKVLEALSYLSSYKHFDSLHHELVHAIQTSLIIRPYLEDVYVQKTIVDLCFTDNDCIHIMTTMNMKYLSANENRIIKNSYFRQRIVTIRSKATNRLTSFLFKAIQMLRNRRAYTQEKISLHARAWSSFVIRYRYVHAQMKKKDCPICMENEINKIILHGEKRHFVCNNCYPHVRAKCCPYCRSSLTSKNINVQAENTYYDNYISDQYDRHLDNDYVDNEFYYNYMDDDTRSEEAYHVFRDEMSNRNDW